MKNKNLDLDKSAKNVYQALVEPMGTITKILRRKLRGSYGNLQVKDLPEEIKWTTGDEGNFTFPGTCLVESIDKKRSITISIKFYWGKWKKKIRIGSLDSRNPLRFTFRDGFQTKNCSLSIKSLENKKFIEELKSWLKGKKTTLELNMKKWEK